jgi:uncharacterized protein (TIGR03382 family)
MARSCRRAYWADPILQEMPVRFARPILFAALAFPADAALACGSASCSSGGVPLPAPAGVAFFALGVTLLLTRRRDA